MGGCCATSEVGIHDRATASKMPRTTQRENIATLLDPERMPTPEGPWPRNASQTRSGGGPLGTESARRITEARTPGKSDSGSGYQQLFHAAPDIDRLDSKPSGGTVIRQRQTASLTARDRVTRTLSWFRPPTTSGRPAPVRRAEGRACRARSQWRQIPSRARN